MQLLDTLKLLGSFRLILGKAYLHAYYSFTESIVETVVVSLNHSCRTAFNGQGISLH